jgi:hypothetical protein
MKRGTPSSLSRGAGVGRRAGLSLTIKHLASDQVVLLLIATDLLSLKLVGIVYEKLLQSGGRTVEQLVDAASVNGAAVAPHALEEIPQPLPPQRQSSP